MGSLAGPGIKSILDVSRIGGISYENSGCGRRRRTSGNLKS